MSECFFNNVEGRLFPPEIIRKPTVGSLMISKGIGGLQLYQKRDSEASVFP